MEPVTVNGRPGPVRYRSRILDRPLYRPVVPVFLRRSLEKFFSFFNYFSFKIHWNIWVLEMRILKIHFQVYFYPCRWCILVQIASHLFNTKLKNFLYRSTGRSGPIILTGTGTGKEKTLPVPSMLCSFLVNIMVLYKTIVRNHKV
jgi:hypothetical protein